MIICFPGLLLLGGLNSGKSAELWIPDSQGCPYVQHMLFLLQFWYTQLFFKEHIYYYIFEDKILDCNFILGSLQGRRICSLPELHRPMAAHTVNVGDQGRS